MSDRLDEHDAHDEHDLPPLSPEDEARVSAALHEAAPMPPEVWIRLERALMDEAARREQGGDAAVAGARDGRPSARSRARTAGIFGLAAAVALVVGGTVIATIDRQQGGQGPGPVAADGSSAMVLASGTDYAPATLAEQVKRTVRQLRDSARQAAPVERSASGMPGMSAVPMTMASTDATTDSSMASSMGSSMPGPSTEVPREMPAGMPADMPFLHDTNDFQGCLHRFVQVSPDEEVAVLLVDIATMQGVVTAVIVIPAGEMPPSMAVDPAMEQVFVVTPGCAVQAHTEVDLDAA